jgi:hypothetical protein
MGVGQAYNGFFSFDVGRAHLVPELAREGIGMLFDLDKVAANARKATTEDLLDRVTIYRGGMEPEAVDIFEAELRQRGVSAEDVAAHRARHQGEHVRTLSGDVLSCSFCRQPAVTERRVWHKLWGVLPILPRRVRLCQEHGGDPEEKRVE